MARPLLALLLALAVLTAPAGGQPARGTRAGAAATVRDSAAPRVASEEALRRYVRGRLLEQSGKLAEALGEYYRALSHDPLSPDLLVRISQVCAHLGDPTRSLEFAERALQQDPDDWRALWLEGAALFSTNRAPEALAPLERACELDSTQAEVLRTTARVAEVLSRADVAERSWRRLVWVDDEDGEAWFQVAAAQARRGDLPGAELSLERANALNADRPGLVFLRGWVQENLGHPEKAIDLYRQHLELHAADVGTRRRLVALYTRSGRLHDAYAEARRVSQADPTDAEAMQVLADLGFKTGHANDAERTLGRLRAQNPGDPENTARAVAVLARNGRGREAARWADRWAAAHPGHLAGPMLSVRAWTLAGLPDSAVARARRAVAAAPDSSEPRRLLARTLVAARRYDDAEREWLALHEKHPSEPGYLLDLGGCREQAGDVDGAIEAGRRALALAPEWPPALNFLGYVMADHGRGLEEARGMIERALRVEPENGAFVDSFGWVLYRQGRLEEAREQLERAVRLTGGDPIVREHLGDCYRDLGRVPDAREQYRLAQEIEGDHQKRVAEKVRALR
jgi:tetratricopeptide (TPR) repeat protein